MVCSVFLVEGQGLVREGLCRLVQSVDGLALAGEAATAREALARLDHVECDVVVVSGRLPDRSGTWCTEQIRKRCPDLPILILAAEADLEALVATVEAGADGYLSKAASSDELSVAVKTVVGGGSFLHAAVASMFIEHLARRSSCEDGIEVSDREVAILGLIGQGRSNQEVADTIHVSLSTVKAHLRSMFERFGVSDRSQLLLEAFRAGLLPDSVDGQQGESVAPLAGCAGRRD